jgi:16S rRNA (guanine(966)-N(2))-methyltransferase RsmD
MTAGDGGRVIAGTARGIRLAAPGPGTRPFGDRVKQTLFAILEPDLPGANVLDLFAGSGAAGIEALSRGAARTTFVERDRGAAAVIAANLGRTHLAGDRARIVRADAIAWLRGPEAASVAPFAVVVLDPPYAETGLLTDALAALGPLVTHGGRVVAKHFWRDPPPAEVGLLASERERRFGETTLTFYRRQEDR